MLFGDRVSFCTAHIADTPRAPRGLVIMNLNKVKHDSHIPFFDLFAGLLVFIQLIFADKAGAANQDAHQQATLRS